MFATSSSVLDFPSSNKLIDIMIRSNHGMSRSSITGTGWERSHTVHALLPSSRCSHVSEEPQDFRIIGDWASQLVQFSEKWNTIRFFFFFVRLVGMEKSQMTSMRYYQHLHQHLDVPLLQEAFLECNGVFVIITMLSRWM